jgi:nucleotide-binding universal stress UspA family protein
VDTIMVGYDGLEAAERALARAAELGERLSARLVVVSVARSAPLPVTAPIGEPAPVFVPSPSGVPMPGADTMPPLEPEPQHFQEPKELAQRQLEHARMILARRHVEAEYVAEVGDPAARLLELAEERGADVLVVGSRARGLLERLLARPVDETVARRAACDVLLVH